MVLILAYETLATNQLLSYCTVRPLGGKQQHTAIF